MSIPEKIALTGLLFFTISQVFIGSTQNAVLPKWVAIFVVVVWALSVTALIAGGLTFVWKT